MYNPTSECLRCNEPYFFHLNGASSKLPTYYIIWYGWLVLIDTPVPPSPSSHSTAGVLSSSSPRLPSESEPPQQSPPPQPVSGSIDMGPLGTLSAWQPPAAMVQTANNNNARRSAGRNRSDLRHNTSSSARSGVPQGFYSQPPQSSRTWPPIVSIPQGPNPFAAQTSNRRGAGSRRVEGEKNLIRKWNFNVVIEPAYVSFLGSYYFIL